MFKYQILKVGRKWYEAVSSDEKKYKAQIEINEFSQGWKVGQVVEFLGNIERKYSGGFAKTYIYPKDTETIKQFQEQQALQKEQQEIERWLGYVENETQYVYRKGVDTLEKMNLSEDQKGRLDAAVKLGTINSAKKKIRDYFGYIENALLEKRWYQNGEDTILSQIKVLEKLNEDTSKYNNQLQELKNSYKNKKAEQSAAYNKRYFCIQDLSNSKYDIYQKGQIYQAKDGRLGKAVKTWKRYEEDTMSLGYLVDGGWLIFAECDTEAVSEQEKIEFFKEKERQQEELSKEKEFSKKKTELKNIVEEFFSYVRKNGNYPKEDDKIQVSGNVIYDTFNVYGGGKRIVIKDNLLWVLKNNGSDGDDWSCNNIKTGGAGAIGYCMTMNDTCNEYLSKIESIKSSISDDKKS